MYNTELLGLVYRAFQLVADIGELELTVRLRVGKSFLRRLEEAIRAAEAAFCF